MFILLLLFVNIYAIDIFSYEWFVKNSTDVRTDPGPNYFAPENVVGDETHLCLKLTCNNGRWYGSELWMHFALGYGTYEWDLEPFGPLDLNVVLRLSVHLDSDHAIEIDFSQRGELIHHNTSYNVERGAYDHWSYPTWKQVTSHRFQWKSDKIEFESFDPYGRPIHSWKYEGSRIPEPNRDMKARMGLWLYNGKAPYDGKEVEVKIQDFAFY